VFKTSWSYAGNYNLTDAGDFSETAGSSWITWTDNSSDSVRGNITTLAIAPNTGSSAGGVFIYNDQGGDYSPGWRQVWTSMTDGSGSGLDADLLDGQQGSYYAPKASPAFTGTPTAPTAAANTNTTQVATTAYVQTELTDLIGGAPTALNTLNELAAAIDDDASYASTLTTALSTKLPLAGGTLTGDLTVSGNQVITTNTSADVKFSVWSGTTYGIGMTSGVTYGGLNDYAMTFCMNNAASRGWWWGYAGQSKSSGAMSLTMAGHLTLAGNATFAGDTFSTGLYINSASAVSGTQVAIVGTGTENLQRWGSANSGQASYRFRIDQNYKFIANSGSGDNITLDSSNGTGFFTGSLSASNLSGTNTGDQTLPTLSSLGALSTSGGTMTGALELGVYASTVQGVLKLNGSTANKQSVIKTTDGNLHIDAASGNAIYLNWYGGTQGTQFGDGSGASGASVSAGGVYTATGGTSTQWNTAYTHSQATHAPSGATVNSADAYLLARANHTGTQAYSTLTGTPTIPSGNAILDWTADQGSSNIHANNITGYINTTEPNESFNPFGGQKFHDGVLTNALAGRHSRFTVTVNGTTESGAPLQLSNQNFEQYSTNNLFGTSAGETKVFSINVQSLATGSVNSSGITYCAGFFDVCFYSNPFPASWSARVKNKDGNWTTVSSFTKIGNSKLRGVIPISNYLTDIEFTLVARTSAPFVTGAITYGISEMEIYFSRIAASQGGNISSLGGYLGGTITTASGTTSNNWNTAYGWGNHASAGYTSNTGDITGVTAGTNLNGGGTSGAVTLNLDSAIELTSVQYGSGVTLSESGDRPDLLYIESATATWGGLQIGNTSSEFIFSLMGDGTQGGIFDDQNSDWILQWTENAGVQLRYNGGTKLVTTNGGVSVTGALTTTGTVTATGGNSTEWNTAYTDRNKWDGGATGLVAATGRTSLGLGTAATTASTAYATSAQGTLATNALPKAGGTMTGNLTMTGSPVLSIATHTGYEIDFTGTTGATNIRSAGTNMFLLAGTGKSLRLGSNNVNTELDLYDGNLTCKTNINPDATTTYDLGSDSLRWWTVFCETLDSAGLHEKNLSNKDVGDYPTGTVLVWANGKAVPSINRADYMKIGIAVEGMNSPLVHGAEPVLCTGPVSEGDYLVTSRKEGHAVAMKRQAVKEQGLMDCVIGKALMAGDGGSHLVKTWLTI